MLRVALAVHRSARPLALLHDVCERTDCTPRHVALEIGIDRDTRHALALLTKDPGEDLLEHVRRVASSPPGGSWELAVSVMRADLADHQAHAAGDRAIYAHALQQLAATEQ